MSIDKLNTRVRQEQITQAALSLININGLRGLNVAGVAKRIGLVPSAIYRHFKGKDQIIDAALDLIFARLLENVSNVRREVSAPFERLKLILVRHVGLILESHAIPRIIFSEEVYSGNSDRKAKLHRNIEAYLMKISEIVQQGQLDNHIRNDVDPGTISVMFLGIIQPAAILWHISDESFDVAKHTEKAWRIFKESLAIK
ncbi:MAG: TetR/AcrR family transcriptional regulator [Desulfobacterales bacterium]|jgi:AcrR family transcriptional regulator